MSLFFYDFSRIRFSQVSGDVLPRRQRLRFDGMSATDNGQEIVMSMAMSGLQVLELAANPGNNDGEVRAANGYATANDGGGGIFAWVQGVTSGADGRFFINAPVASPTGQWQRLIDGDINVRWFGAVGDGTTLDTVAFQAAIDYCVANQKTLFVPAGDYHVDTLTIGAQLRMYGAGMGCTIIRARYPYSGGASASGSAAKGVIELYNAGTMHDVTVEHLTIYGDYSWNASTVVNANHMRHGIYVHPVGDTYNIRLRHIRVAGVSGDGFNFNSAIFQSSLHDCHADETGGDSFNISGNNTLKFQECTGGSMATTRAMFRFVGGDPFIDSCNGIPQQGINPAIHRISWGIFGVSPGVCRATIVGCNIEAFTAYGCKFGSQSHADFKSTSVIHTANCVARALHYDNVNQQALTGNIATLYPPTNGTWGNPDTQSTDNIAVYSVGVPFLSKDGASWVEVVNADGTITLPKLSGSGSYNSFRNYPLVANRFAIEEEFAQGPSITVAASPYTIPRGVRTVFVDTSGGAVTLTFSVAANLHDRRMIEVVKITGDANDIIIDPPGGETVNGAATYTWSDAYSRRKIYCGRANDNYYICTT